MNRAPIIVLILLIVIIIVLIYMFPNKTYQNGNNYLTILGHPNTSNDIRIGVLEDLSSITADVGRDTGLATREVVQYINDTGGINGIPLTIFQYDTSYYPSNAIKAYHQFKNLGVSLMIGWNTGETEALINLAARDHLPIISHAAAAMLTDPRVAPYNFVYSTDYSTNARGALTIWYEKVWLQHDSVMSRPRVQCIFDMMAPYTAQPIIALKDQAKILGFEILPDINLKLQDSGSLENFHIENFIPIVDKIKKYRPDVIWHGNTRTQVRFTLLATNVIGLKSDHLINNWAFDRLLARQLAHVKIGRIFGVVNSSFFGEDVPMMDTIIAYAKKVHPYVEISRRELRTVQTWILFLMIRDILIKANGNLSGENIKNQLEHLRNWTISLQGHYALGRTPINIYSNDHRVSSIVKLYEIVCGDVVFFSQINMRKSYPNLWLQWLGI